MGDSWEWHDDWARLGDVPGADRAFAHHGLAVTADGDVVGFHARQLIRFGPDGRVVSVVPTPLFEGHQITLVSVDSSEQLWIADPGMCLHRATDGNLGHGLAIEGGPGRAVRMDLSGEILQELPRPALPHGTPYMPTSVAVDATDDGGRGDVWVADGYGSSLVHRYDVRGELLDELDGTHGAGRFECPHAVFVDRRQAPAQLCVADRGNARVQVFDLDGRFLRCFGEGTLTSPSSFAVVDGRLVVAELRARLAIYDDDDALVELVGEDHAAADRPGWPNALDSEANVVRPDELRPGRFNSPHAVAAADDGSLFVAEWLVGGRYTKLTRRKHG